MTYFPDYLKTYPNMDSSFPFHFSRNTLDRGFRAHRHDYLEFSYVVNGRGAETINDVKHTMTPGTFTFVLPYQVHEIFTDPGASCPIQLLVQYGPAYGARERSRLIRPV